MALPRSTRVRLVWALELSLGLALYACAVLALHARGLRATPLEASPALVLPALVIPPVFYVLVGLVTMRPLSVASVLRAAATMWGLHAVLVLGTGALFMIPDLLDYRAAAAFALWGSPPVTLLQLTAAPLIFARLRPLLSPRAARAEARVVLAQRRAERPQIAPSSRPLGSPATAPPGAIRRVVAPTAAPVRREPVAAPPAQPQPASAVSAPISQPAPPAAKPPAPSSTPVIVSHPGAPGGTVLPATPAPTGQGRVGPATETERHAVTQSAPPASVVEPAPMRGADTAPTATKPTPTPRKLALDWTEPMIRVPFARVVEQLPVEMFARGREGLNDTMRPGVSLLVPRNLVLPHLGEALAPVRWEVVADQFPLDELALSHEEIADRLPDGSLLLPLDEVIPQIPPALLALSTPPVDARAIEEFPAPFQPDTPAPADVAAPDVAAAQRQVLAEADGPAVDETLEDEATLEDEETVERTLEDQEVVEDQKTLDEATPEPESVREEPAGEDEAVAPAGPAPAAATPMASAPTTAAPAAPVPSTLTPIASAVTAATPIASATSVPPEAQSDVTAQSDRAEQTRRIAALLAPLLNGLEIGERAGAGTTLVTVFAPTLHEDSVVRTATRIVPFLGDPRLAESVTQATLTAAQATLVLTPFGSNGAAAILLTAVASRASLAWLERMSRAAARDAHLGTVNGKHSGRPNDPGSGIELRAATVPATVREVAGSLTAFGAVTPTLLRDHAGTLSACLFLPRSLDALPLAGFARDLHLALAGAEIGPVTSLTLKLGAHRLVLRALNGASGHVTMLMGVGPVDRPGLARIELDRAAARLGPLVGA
jgi:hypothetical protein